VLGGLVLWNATLVAVARGGSYRIGQPVSFGDVGGAQARVLHDWIGHLPSAPANLVYAARNGVPPGRYDLLGPNRFLGDPTRQYGRIDVGAGDDVFIAAGWHQPERSGDATFRWATREASVLVPLDHAAALVVQVRVLPFEPTAAPPQSLTVVVNGVASEAVGLAADWQVAEVLVPSDRWRAGVNRVVLRFARELRPADVGGGGDTRALAAAVDYVRVVSPAAR
jgi:hypothetical protein